MEQEATREARKTEESKTEDESLYDKRLYDSKNIMQSLKYERFFAFSSYIL